MAKDKSRDAASKVDSASGGLLTKAVIVICALIALLCLAKYALPAQAGSQDAESAAEQAAEQDEQARLAALSTDEREVEAILANGVWVSDDARMQASFSKGQLTTVTDTTQADPVNYEIDTVSVKREQNSSRGTTIVTYTFVMRVDAKEAIAFLSQVQSATGVDADWQLESDALLSGEQLTNQPITGHVEVVGLDSSADSALGGADARERLVDEVEDFCTRTFPTAKAAVWDSKLTIDYPKDRAEARFTVDNRAQTKLLVYYNFADGSVNIQEG